MLKLPDHIGQRVDFQKQFSESAQQTLIAFINSYGGTIYFGVDEDGTPCGVDADETIKALMHFAAQQVEPPMDKLISPAIEKIGDLDIVTVYVDIGADIPYCFKGRTWEDHGVYVRHLDDNVPAGREEIIEMIRSRDPRPWESRTYFRADYLTFEAAQKFFDERNIEFTDQDYLRYALTDSQERITNLGYLMSDQNASLIIFNTMSAADDESILKSELIKGALPAQLEKVLNKLNELNALTSSLQHVDPDVPTKPAWPPQALHDALIFSLMHRDFSSQLPLIINFYPHHIDFTVPCTFPLYVTLRMVLEVGFVYYANPKLAELFKKMALVKMLAGGPLRINDAYLGIPVRPAFAFDGDKLTISLPKQMCLLGVKEQVMSIMSTEPKSRAFIEKELDIGRVSATNALNALIKAGLIKKHGKGRSTLYSLNTIDIAD